MDGLVMTSTNARITRMIAAFMHSVITLSAPTSALVDGDSQGTDFYVMTLMNVAMDLTSVIGMQNVKTLWALINVCVVLGFPAMVMCVKMLTNAAMEVIFAARTPDV